MNTNTTRMIMCTKDIMNITGKGNRTARKIGTAIKRKNNTPYVTVETFCRYMGLDEKKILASLDNN